VANNDILIDADLGLSFSRYNRAHAISLIDPDRRMDELSEHRAPSTRRFGYRWFARLFERVSESIAEIAIKLTPMTL